jgi:hypothetical protein
LSGIIVQPVIGVISDDSRSRWGRRRPIIAAGSVIVALSLLMLGFTKEIVGVFIPDKGVAETLTIILAVVALYSVDFSINAGESLGACRSGLRRLTRIRHSNVLFEESAGRHSANIQTANRRRMGWVADIPPLSEAC